MPPRDGLWLPLPPRLLLGDDEVHVCRAVLRREPAAVRTLRAVLAPDERRRADRFQFRKDYEHFVVARGVLRAILGRYLDVAPEQVRFSYNEFGKPALDGGTGGHSLRFNLSHSHGVALYAVTRGREVGLDIEFIREDFAALATAGHFFSPCEVSALRAAPRELQAQAFFNCWTRKEAYIKALGSGLSHPLHSFSVSLAPGDPARLLSTDGDPREASRWSLTELFPGAGYAAAMAVRAPAPALRCWQWTAED